MNFPNNDWATHLENEIKEEYFQQLVTNLIEEYETKQIYPSSYDVFKAFSSTSFNEVKAVIIGQDPYHGPNQAHGLSFSVKKGVAIPPSLKNIYKELNNDLGCYIPNHGNLTKWAEQGVLMLNTVLTVQEGQPNSHKGMGWERFTNKVIEVLNERKRPIIFILWGKHAQEKGKIIDKNRHYVIQSPHPSPFSANRGFFGSSPFSKANRYLEEIGSREIDWQIDNI